MIMSDEVPTQPTNGGTNLYRIGRLETDRRKDVENFDELEKRVRELENEVGKLQERMTLFQAAQAAFTTIASAIAVIFGRM
jgi:phosphoglycerate-specific signal transduction histidine kinase